MELDRETCRRARLARDPRFDGRFFVGVATTGVFCRPICPAVPPRESNVRYFRSAAAAAEAGFRPCLRCRPECAPGTPAWNGTSVTVSRGLRLIARGALEAESVEQLAGRLGIGPRHLRRLFVEHLGASPIAVAQTYRLLSAKTLVDQTDMPLTRVAMAAGFRSLRRFNSAFLQTYGRSPRSFRQSGRTRVPSASYTLELRYRPPFDWDALVGFLAPRAIPGVEAIEPRAYRRTILSGGQVTSITVTPTSNHALRVELELPEAVDLLRVVSRVRRMFDLDADPLTINPALSGDPVLAPLVERQPGLRVPGAWDWFELTVRAVLGQQVTVAGATTLAGRLVQRFGRPLSQPQGLLTHAFPAPAVLATADVGAIGLPTKRAQAIREVASAAAAGELAGDGTMAPEAFLRRLLAIPGVGPWTAQYVAMRSLGDPDAFPSQDLGLLRATGCGTANELEKRSQPWRPWRAYAALHLWSARSDETAQRKTASVAPQQVGRGIHQ